MRCNWQADNGHSCDRKATISEFCIFHKENKTKRENILFFHYIKKGKIDNFEGFIFEEEFKAKDILNYNHKKLKFDSCVFYKKVDFSSFIFNTKVDFINCKFLDDVSFTDCKVNDTFTLKDSHFNKNIINKKIFKNAKINSQDFIIYNNKNLPRLDGILFSRESKFVFRNCHYDSYCSDIGKVNYSIAKIQADRIRDCSNIGYYNYNERKYINRTLSRDDFNNYPEYILSKALNYISREFMGYGEHIIKFFIYIISIISLFAFLYMILGVSKSPEGILKLSLEDLNKFTFLEFIKFYLQFWYFSFVTFTTVGFGDIVVNGVLGKVLVCIEVFLGVTMEGTWTALIINRMFR